MSPPLFFNRLDESMSRDCAAEHISFTVKVQRRYKITLEVKALIRKRVK
jgi:hypothetical protein